MTQSPDPASYTWGLALIAIALSVALLGAVADRVRPSGDVAAAAMVVSDPMGLTLPELAQPADCVPATPVRATLFSAIPTD